MRLNRLNRLARLAPLSLAPLLALAALAAAGTPPYERLRGLFAASAEERRAAADLLLARPDRALVPGIVDALFFLPRDHRDEAFDVLEGLAGERPGRRYQDWLELVGRRQDLVPRAGYTEWKAELFARIDPRYRQVFYPGAPSRIRLEEIVSGGVRFEGIPALDQPPHLPAAAAAGTLDDGERVFGVSSGGEQRAYPLRYLDWHEMANDVVGDQPITLSYCTLCGSGVLFDTRGGGPGAAPYTFGSSGLLYRSNKLMVDRATLSLWSNLTGEPAVGRLVGQMVGPMVGKSPRLPILPLTLTTWKDWRTRHPATTVVVLDPAYGRRWGYEYAPGAADRKRAGVRFPVPFASAALADREPVFAVRLDGHAKVYPVARVLAAGVVNDRVNLEAVVLVADPASGAVRAYRRGGHTFQRAAGGSGGELRDETGRRWRLGEEALVPLGEPAAPAASATPATPADTAAGPAPETALPRLPGHLAFWFGWYAAFPDTELYGGGS